MKRLLFFLSLLLFFGQLSAQRYTPMPTWYEFFQVKFKDHLQVPILKKTTSDSALLAYGEGKLWLKTDTGWSVVGAQQAALDDTAKALRTASNQIDVFLIGGQSNARGVGDSAVSPNPSPNTVYQYTSGTFSMVTNEVGNLPGTRGSMWPAFGIHWNQLTGRKICFVPTAADGTGQTVASDIGYGNWSPSGTLFSNSVAQLNAALAAIVAAGHTPVLKGVLWYQGENDGKAINNSLQTAADYKTAFQTMMSNYRTLFGSNLPFYIYQIGTATDQSDVGYSQIRVAQQEVADADPIRNILVSTNSIDYVARTMMADNVHLNQFALNEQGQIGAEMIVNGKTREWRKSGTWLSYFNNVGVNVKLPAFPLDISGSTLNPNTHTAQLTNNSDGFNGLLVKNINSGSGAGSTVRFENNIGLGAQIAYSSSTHALGAYSLFMHAFHANSSVIIGATNEVKLFTGAGGPTASNTKFRISPNGNIGIGSNVTANASALVDMASTTKGVLFPRMNTTQQNAISSPATGLTIYNTDSAGYVFYNGISWTALASITSILKPEKIIIGDVVDPLYGISVKKVYDPVTQANFSTTVGKYPFYVDKDVRFAEDSMSMWPVPGDNAGLNILRYKGQSVVNFQNTVNRFTGHHAVLSFEKYPGFMDTTIFYGRAAPYPAETCIPSGFSAIYSQSQSGLASTRPNVTKGWIAALSAEVQMGGTAFNKVENAIWIHTGGIGNAAANAITNGYGIYINPFGSGVTNKYALYQQGTADTVYLGGRVRLNGLSGTGTRLTTVSPIGVLGSLTAGSNGQAVGYVSGSLGYIDPVLLTGNQSIAGVKSYTDRMVITKGSGITPDVNNLLYIGRNEPGNFYPLGIFEDGTDDGYAQFGVWGKARKWNFGVGNGPSSFFGVQDKFYVLDATSNNIRFSIDTDGTVEIPELLKAKGNVATRIRTITSSTTIDEYDHTILIDASGGPVTVTLPSSASSYYGGYGITYVLKRIDGSGNTITIQPGGSDTIDGGATANLNTTAKQTITIQAAGGAAWYIIKN